MIELLLLIILCSLFCFGFNYATLYTPLFEQKGTGSPGDPIKRIELYPTDDKKELLWFIRYYGNKWLPVYLTKPLYGCLMCMGSVSGTIFYWSHVLSGNICLINSKTVVIWVVVVVATTGLNRILKGLAQL